MAEFKMVFLGLLICFTFARSGGIETTDITAVQRGLNSAKSISITANNFLTAIKSLSSKISPYLQVFTSVLSFVFDFIKQQSPSPELLAIKQLYEVVNAKFDHMEARLTDIENGIYWGQALAPLLSCERGVRIALASFQQLLQNPPPDVDGQRNVLLDRYRSQLNCPHILYFAIVNDTGLSIGYSNNILQQGKVHLENDRTKMREFMISLIGLMYKAATMDLLYLKFRVPNNLNYTVQQWSNRFNQIQRKMLATDEEVYSIWYSQAEKDVQKLTSGNVAISNKEMSELLYKSLSTKYYWRDWLVIVYDPVTGGDAHYVWECGGFYKPRYYNRNLLVSSVDNNKPIMDINIAKSKMASLNTTYRNSETYDAGAIFNWFSPDVRTQCSPFASVGVINYRHDVWYSVAKNSSRFIQRHLGYFTTPDRSKKQCFPKSYFETFYVHMFG